MQETDKSGNQADLAYQELRSLIVSGVLKPAERLTEARAADILKLSRTPVREAIKKLILQGFLKREPGKGIRIAGLSADEMEQIFQLRQILESFAVRRAASFASDEEISELRVIADKITQLSEPDDGHDFDELSQANADFHQLLTRSARSPRLSALHSIALDIGLVMRTYRMYTPQDLRRSASHHHEIVTAMKARNPSWAAAVMSAHLHAAEAVISRSFKPEAD